MQLKVAFKWLSCIIRPILKANCQMPVKAQCLAHRPPIRCQVFTAVVII